jgi:iron complex outermembrane receptor protein
MKSKILLIVLSQFLYTGIISQELRKQAGIAGKVTDANTGLPLAGASITIDDAKKGTISDGAGNFLISNVPVGHHVIEVSFMGYGSIVEHIDIRDQVKKDYNLFPAIVENQGIVVTGVSSATSIRKAPVPVLSIRKNELLQSSSTNIIDALSKKPGISQLSTGPGISKPIIRGLGYNRVVVVNDGVRQEGQQWGDEHGIEIDDMSVNKVEILKGPASLMYGSDALAGVIHFISHVPVAEGTIKGNALYNFQSNNSQSGVHASISGNRNDFNWNAYGSFKSAGDYRNKYDGRVLNSRFNEKNFGGYIGINKSWGYSHLVFSSFHQDVGLIEGERDATTGNFILYGGSPLEHVATGNELNSRSPMIPKQDIRHFKIISDNAITLNRNRIKLNVGFQNNVRREYGNPEDVNEEELHFDLKTISYNLQWQLPQAKDWHVTLGASGMFQKNTNKAEEVIIPEYDIFDIGSFLFAQRFLKKMTLSGGLRIDHRSLNSEELIEDGDTRFNPFKKNFTNVSGSAGISIEPNEHITLKLNVGRGFRAPNMAELGSNGAHEGTNRYEYGDYQLKSENSLQFDAGIDMDKDHYSLSLSAFYNHVSNFIYNRKLNSTVGGDSIVLLDGEELIAYRFDQQHAALAGFEAEIDLHPHPLDWLHFENSFSYVRGRFNEAVDGTRNLPMIPAARWSSELRANLNDAGKSIKNVYIRAGVITTLKQDKPFTAYDTEFATSGYSLLNAGIGFEFHSKKRQLFSLHIAGNNLTDVAYIDHLSRLKYAAINEVTGRQGVFNAGRNVSVKLNLVF